MLYLCPLCQHPLQLSNGTYRCQQDHAFDQAKEGYVNLMPVQHKQSKNPGDNQLMMQARRQFLNSGHYQPLRDAVQKKLTQCLTASTAEVLDLGCGEGYYTRYFAQQTPQHQFWGLDISKVAIRYAAKQDPLTHYVVASSHRLPFETHSLDAVIRIYAPCKPQELLRCIKPEGFVITVTPAARHLYQLKENIYQSAQEHDEAVEDLVGFNCIQQQELHYTMSLSGQEAADLLQMTPFAWRADENLHQQLYATPKFECEAHFLLRIYQKGTNTH